MEAMVKTFQDYLDLKNKNTSGVKTLLRRPLLALGQGHSFAISLGKEAGCAVEIYSVRFGLASIAYEVKKTLTKAGAECAEGSVLCLSHPC